MLGIDDNDIDILDSLDKTYPILKQKSILLSAWCLNVCPGSELEGTSIYGKVFALESGL